MPGVLMQGEFVEGSPLSIINQARASEHLRIEALKIPQPNERKSVVLTVGPENSSIKKSAFCVYLKTKCHNRHPSITSVSVSSNDELRRN